MTKVMLAAVAAALAFAAQAADDKAKTGASANKGADATFNALDKNKDGFLTREETKGTPRAEDFHTLDKNRDGKLTPEEHAAAPKHAKDRAAAGGTRPESKPAKTESRPKQ